MDLAATTAATTKDGEGEEVAAIPTFERDLPQLDQLPELFNVLRRFNWLHELVKLNPLLEQVLRGQPQSQAAIAAQQPQPLRSLDSYRTILAVDDLLISAALYQLCHYYLGLRQSPPAPTDLAMRDPFVADPYKIETAVDLSDVLRAILVDDTNPPHMSVAQRDLANTPIEFPPQTKAALVSMYLHLMSLIKSVLIRINFLTHGADYDRFIVDGLSSVDESSATSMTSAPTTTTSLGGRPTTLDAISIGPAAHDTVLKILLQLLGNLESVRLVLLHAEVRGFVSYGNYPRKWADIISEATNHVHECVKQLHRIHNQIFVIKQSLNVRDQKIQAIRDAYVEHAHNLSLENASMQSLLHELRHRMSVRAMLTSYDPSGTDAILNIGRGLSGAIAFGR